MNREGKSTFVTGKRKRDSRGLLSDIVYNPSEPECLPSTSTEETKTLKRKHEDEEEASGKITKMGDSADCAATTSTSHSLQTVNTMQEIQGDNVCWPPEAPGPSQAPSSSQERPGELYEPVSLEAVYAQEASEKYISLHEAFFESFGTVKFYIQRRTEILQSTHASPGRTCTVTNTNVTTDNNIYNAYQQNLNPATQQGQSNFYNAVSCPDVSDSEEEQGGFSMSYEGVSDYSVACYKSTNTSEPMDIDPAPSSSYMVDDSSGIHTLVPRPRDDNTPSTTDVDNFRLRPDEMQSAQNMPSLSPLQNIGYDNSMYEEDANNEILDSNEHDGDESSNRGNENEIGVEAEDISEIPEIYIINVDE